MCLLCWCKLLAVEFCPRLADGAWCGQKEWQATADRARDTGRRQGRGEADRAEACGAQPVQGVWTLKFKDQEDLLRVRRVR